jgi:hypothetical protein
MTPSNSDLRALSARLDKLESQALRWKLAAMVLALLSASLVLAAAKPADHIDSGVIHARTVEARDFVVRDQDGQVRARLTLNSQAKTKNDLIDPTVNMNAPLGPVLQFYNVNGNAIWTAPQEPTVIPAR